MEVQAITRNVRMSAQKMREVVRQIQGPAALQPQAVRAVEPRKAARGVAQARKAAIANAENNDQHEPAAPVSREAVAQAAATLKRFVPKARGAAGPILKRSCHVK